MVSERLKRTTLSNKSLLIRMDKQTTILILLTNSCFWILSITLTTSQTISSLPSWLKFLCSKCEVHQSSVIHPYPLENIIHYQDFYLTLQYGSISGLHFTKSTIHILHAFRIFHPWYITRPHKLVTSHLLLYQLIYLSFLYTQQLFRLKVCESFFTFPSTFFIASLNI